MPTLLTRKAQKIQIEKGLILIIWSTSGIHSLLACRLGSDTMRIFLCIYFDIERNFCDPSVGRCFEVSAPISIVH
jgi:hypothetical protein